MPRQSRGPRLYLRRGRRDTRSGRQLPDLYYIRDGARELGTGVGPDRLAEAEAELAAYIVKKQGPAAASAARARTGPSDPADVLVAEVLSLYAEERAPHVADPVSAAVRIRNLDAWWADKSLADVRRSNCKAYVAHRVKQPNARARTPDARRKLVSDQTARRELEDLSAAIGWWAEEYPLLARPSVWLPLKPESPRDALTRGQAAALLKAAMGYRRQKDGAWKRLGGSARANRAHLRRYILIGLYTGTREAVMRALLWEESARQAWTDLDGAMIYRRGREERDSPTKRRPVVQLPPRLLAHLKRWRALDLKEAERRRDPDAEPHHAAPCCTVLHHGGAPIASKIRRAFAACVRDAGLPPEVTPHWMRHTAATWLMEADAKAWEAAGYMGMTVATLEKHYGHHRPSYQAGVAGSKRRKA